MAGVSPGSAGVSPLGEQGELDGGGEIAAIFSASLIGNKWLAVGVKQRTEGIKRAILTIFDNQNCSMKINCFIFN